MNSWGQFINKDVLEVFEFDKRTLFQKVVGYHRGKYITLGVKVIGKI